MPELVWQHMEKHDFALSRTRFALNFKGIPYKTEWVPYIHLQDYLKSKGIKPHPPGSWSDYSVPTIQLPDGTYLMDSAEIIKKLESDYPEPSLYLNQNLEKEAESAMMSTFRPLALYMMGNGINKIVAPEDLEWFEEDRARRFGMTVEQLTAPKDPAEAYANAQPGFEASKKVLTTHKKDDGPFILGSTPCYADFYFASFLEMFSRLDSEIFDRFIKEAGPEMKALHEACAKWTVKAD